VLASGAHVKIGAYEYVLDLEASEPYVHEYAPLFPQGGGEVFGSDGKRHNRPDLLFWSIDDWSGGQGFKYWDPRDPTAFYDGNYCCTRVPGEITQQPIERTITGLPTPSESDVPIFLAQGGGYLWLATSRQVAYSTDGYTWTAHTSNPLGAAGDEITAISAEGKYCYVALHTDMTASGTRKVLQLTAAPASATFVSNVTSLPFQGMATLDGGLYGWTGRSLVRYDLNATLPITHDSSMVKYQPGDDTVTSGSVVKMCEGGKSIFFMASSAGATQIYEWRKDTPTPIWAMPKGFTGKDMCVSNDTLFVIGTRGTGKADLYGMNIASRVPLYLADVSQSAWSTEVVRTISPSYGHQVIFTVGVSNSNTITSFVYDAEYDSVSWLKYGSSIGEKHASATFEGVRTVIGNKLTGTTLGGFAVRTDNNKDTTNTQWDFTSGWWDFGYPFAKKVLHGFHIFLDPLPASSTITVKYGTDLGSTVDFTVSPTITTDSSTYVWLPISSSTVTRTFRHLSMYVQGDYGAKLKSITAQCQMMEYTESWKLRLRLKDSAANARARTSKATAQDLRDNLTTLVENKAIVTFLNGAKYTEPGVYDTETVTVEFPRDVIGSNAEGYAEVVLRSITNV